MVNPTDPPSPTNPPNLGSPGRVSHPPNAIHGGSRDRRAKLLVWEGRSAQEISRAIPCSLSQAYAYTKKWEGELNARDEEERNQARALALQNYQLTLQLLQEAKGASMPILVKGEPLVRPDGTVATYEVPQWDVVATLLGELRETTEQLGGFARAIGPMGVAKVRAQSDQALQAREQGFKEERPDLIPGLGFNHPSGPSGGMGGGAMQVNGGATFQFLLNPKTPEALAIDRQRLEERRQIPAGQPGTVLEPVDASEVDEAEEPAVD